MLVLFATELIDIGDRHSLARPFLASTVLVPGTIADSDRRSRAQTGAPCVTVEVLSSPIWLIPAVVRAGHIVVETRLRSQSRCCARHPWLTVALVLKNRNWRERRPVVGAVLGSVRRSASPFRRLGEPCVAFEMLPVPSCLDVSQGEIAPAASGSTRSRCRPWIKQSNHYPGRSGWSSHRCWCRSEGSRHLAGPAGHRSAG